MEWTVTALYKSGFAIPWIIPPTAESFRLSNILLKAALYYNSWLANSLYRCSVALLLSFIQELCSCYLQWDHAGALPQSHRMVLRSCLESEFSKLGVVPSHSCLFASGLRHDFRTVEQVHNRAGEHKLHFFFPVLHATWTFKIGWKTLYIWCARIYIKITSFPVNSPLSVRQFILCLLVFLQLFAQSGNAAVRQLSKS